MDTWPVIAGLVIVAFLILIPVVMAGQMVHGVITSWVEHRRAEARRITVTLPGLGEFSTTDNALWFGEVRQLQISLKSERHPPTQEQINQLSAVLDQLPLLTSRATTWLADHEDLSWLAGGAAAFEPAGIDFESESHYVLELIHPGDKDGIYRVEFRDGKAVSSGRDD